MHENAYFSLFLEFIDYVTSNIRENFICLFYLLSTNSLSLLKRITKFNRDIVSLILHIVAEY